MYFFSTILKSKLNFSDLKTNYRANTFQHYSVSHQDTTILFLYLLTFFPAHIIVHVNASYKKNEKSHCMLLHEKVNSIFRQSQSKVEPYFIISLVTDHSCRFQALTIPSLHPEEKVL